MNHTLISLTEPEKWNSALQGVPHAFGHTWESCYAMHLTSGLPTYLYTCQTAESRIVCPIAEREFNGHTDIVTPYGFSGFAGFGSLPGFAEHWKAFAKGQGYVCGYIGLNPLLENTSYLSSSDVSEYNMLYVLDLRQSMDVLYRRLSLNRKRQLKNYDDIARQFITDKAILKPFFLEHFHTFFNQRNAAPVYGFSTETLAYLLDLDNVLAVGVVENDSVVAVSVFGYTLHVADYLFNISVGDGKNFTVPLIWYAVNYFQGLSIPFLNLGGGVRKDDSLAQFKERFGADKYGLKCLKQIYDPAVYFQLCGDAGSDPGQEGYFPPYRAPEKLVTIQAS